MAGYQGTEMQRVYVPSYPGRLVQGGGGGGWKEIVV